jgi:uncharacterized protein
MAEGLLDPVILIDADACPVKEECYKVAGRHGLKVFLVANRLLQAPRHPMIERVLVAQGADAADDWIAERAGAGTIVVTADIPLAARCVRAGAFVLAPDGRIFDDNSIGMALAMRNLMEDLRSSGAMAGGPGGFSPRDRSAFLSTLERGVQQARRRASRET